MDLNNIQKYLLKEIADMEGTPDGAYNIRSDSCAIDRKSTENVEITSKEIGSGLDIRRKCSTTSLSARAPM